ncbi:ParA family protein [Abyssisolibacter fermentans]|uniref:ParA family protein n=1 Tax=Abyssisolibacter fermentans TaxID=1766203 RepID=UPI00082D8720|nr:AAA family ATPase [Abyssisolibacter fermentans]
MSKSVAIFNQKGGVGKTTTNINLSACLAKLNKKVLVVDIDPQGNTTSGLGVDKNEVEYSLYDCLIDGVDTKKAIIQTYIDKLDIVTSDVELAGAEVELANRKNRELTLKKVLNQVKNDYDYIFIDCPPSLGMLTINALAAVDSVIIPIQCEYYALVGVSQLIDTIKLMKKSINKDIIIEGVIMNMYDSRTILSKQVVEQVKNYFKEEVYNTLIPRNVRLAESPSFGLAITDFDAKSKGAIAYTELAKEFMNR